MACGTYTSSKVPDGAILRSHDQGRTFQRTKVPFKFGGNEDGRGNGERMAVDPNDGKILFLGTRKNGLWTSRDGAETWFQVESFPDVSEKLADPKKWWEAGSGIVFTVFDPASGSRGVASSSIYAGVSLMGRPNLFHSADGGKTWQPVPGAPTQYRPTHGVTGFRWHVLSFVRHQPRSLAHEGWWRLETGYPHRSLDGDHAREARRWQDLRIRRRGGGRQGSEETHRQHVRPHPQQAAGGRYLP